MLQTLIKNLPYQFRNRRWRAHFSSLGRCRLVPIMFPRNQQEQRDATDDGKDGTVIEHRRMADPIPQQSGNDARDQLQQADGGAVPADAACAQMVRHEIRGKRLADSAEYPLIQSVEDKQRSDEKDVCLLYT